MLLPQPGLVLVAAPSLSVQQGHAQARHALAQGDLTRAEQLLTSALRSSPTLPPTPWETALPEPWVKAALARDTGTAALHNDRAVVRLLLGELQGAQEDLDQAATLRPEWAPPWTNGAFLWLARNNAQKALESAILARSYGGDDAPTLTALAEAAIRRRQGDVARDALQKAMERSPRYPYALQVRALLEESQGRGREGERLRLQALALLAQTATAGRYQPWLQEQQASLGTGQRGRLSWGVQEVQRGRFTLGELHMDQQDVESRSDATQTRLRLQGATATGGEHQHQGTFFRLIRESGERPSAGGQDRPRTVTEQFTTLAQVRQQQRGSTSALSGVIVRAGQNPHLRDSEQGIEARWERPQQAAGFSLLHLQRTGSVAAGSVGFPAPSEPHDQLLGAGTTWLATGYALWRGGDGTGRHWQVGSLFGWNQSALATLPTRSFPGLLSGGSRQSLTLLPTGFVQWQLSPRRQLHLSMVPRFGAATGDFLPGALLSGPVFLVPGATDDPGTRTFFPDTVLLGPEGKRIDLDLLLTEALPQRTQQVRLLHQRFSHAFTLEGDPRFTPQLPLATKRHAERTGLQLQALLAAWEASLLVQSSHALPLPQVVLRLRHDRPLPEGVLGTLQLDHWRRQSRGYVVGGGESSATTAVTLMELGAERRDRGRVSFARLRLPLAGSGGYFSGYPLETQLVVGQRFGW